jgi:hypothetical protein
MTDDKVTTELTEEETPTVSDATETQVVETEDDTAVLSAINDTIEEVVEKEEELSPEEELAKLEAETKLAETRAKLLEAKARAKEAAARVKAAEEKLHGLDAKEAPSTVEVKAETSDGPSLSNVSFGNIPKDFKPDAELAGKAQEVMNEMPQQLQDNVMNKTMTLMQKNPAAFQKAMSGDYSALLSDPEYLTMMNELMKDPDYMAGMAKLQQMK